MPVRIVEGQLPYTGGTGIEIDANKVISLLLREENNLILVNDDNEIYTDLQLASNIKPTDDFPVGVTTGKILQSDGWTRSGLLLNRKTTSGDYARWIYANDGKIYFDNGTGTWKQVYYSSEIDGMIQDLNNYVDLNFQPKLTAGAGITIDANNVISAQGAGTGDVVGPASSTDGHLAVFDGATGKLIKDGGAIPTGDVGVSTDTGTLLSAGVDLWLGTETDFSSISTPDSNTLYIQYKSDGGGGWQPGANTLLYLPFTTDILDHSGNSVSITSNNTQITTLSGVDCLDLNNSYINASINVTALPYTISFWVKPKSSTGAIVNLTFGEGGTWGAGGIIMGNSLEVRYGNPTDEMSTVTYSHGTDRQNIVFSNSSAGCNIYVNGVLLSNPKNSLTAPINNASPFSIGGWGSSNYNAYMGAVILESKEWSAQEVADYYDLTKGDYGIS